MTTLIRAQGAGAGGCDAKCYDAQGPDCDCVCGGMNHGAGLQIAVDYMRQLTIDQLEQIIARGGGWIPGELRQQNLF